MIDDDKVEPQHCVAADTAFPVSGRLTGRIISPLKEGELAEVPADCRLAVERHSLACTSIRQACEWGMEAVEKIYRKLLIPLPYNVQVRQIRLTNIHRLYN
jgi:hypothetical protein